MKKITLFIFCVLSFTSYAQQWEWAKSIGSWSTYPPFVRTNNVGDVFTVSTYESGSSYLYLSLFTKHRSSGALIWSKTLGGINQWNFIKDVAIDKNDNIYMIGKFSSSLTLAGNTIYASNGWEIFIASFDQHGAERWIRHYPAIKYNSNGDYLSIDNNDDLVIAGYNGSDTLRHITKISSSGNEIWTKSYSYAGNINIVRCDSYNNIYVGGSFNGNEFKIDGIIHYQDTGYYTNSYLAKLKPTGELEKVEIIQGSHLLNAEFDNNNNLYLSGVYYQAGMKLRQYDFPAIMPCGYDCREFFIAKLNTVDSCSWAKTTTNSNSYSSSLIVSKNGDLYVSGSALSFDSIQTSGCVSIFKFNNDGVIQWKQQNDGTSSSCWSTEITCSEDQSIYLVGHYQSNNYFKCWFGNDTLPETGYNYDFFLAKLTDNQTEISTIANETENKFLVFPNPSTGKFTIQSTEKISSIEIINLLGEKIYSFYFLINDKRLTINLCSQPKGIYFVQIVADNKRTVRKIVLN